MILLVVRLSRVSQRVLPDPRNLLNVGRQASVVAIVALGEALVIISRGLDLSVGSTLGLAAVASAYVGQWSGDQIIRFPGDHFGLAILGHQWNQFGP